MALVRRVDVMGPAAVGRAVVVPQGNPPTAPAQGPSTQGPPLQGPPAGADAPPQSLSSAVPTWAGNIEAVAVASKGAGLGTIAFSFLLVALGTAAAYALQRWGNHATPFRIGNQTSAYAGVVVFAAAVERFIEPFSHFLPGGKTRNDYENTVAAMTNGHPTVTLREVAAAKARQDRAVANRTVLLWGLATAIAAAATGASGFYLLHMIAASDWAVDIPLWVDAMVTGLVVGTGTKPLHDLITRAQAGRD
jgi:hypothetical protein